MNQEKKLYRQRIYFDEEAWERIKVASNSSGYSFSIIISALVNNHLPQDCLEELDNVKHLS